MSDITYGKAGNDERLAFIFDWSRVKPSGLAAELVVEPTRLARMGGTTTLTEQFVRTPYAVSFQRGGATFIFATLHVIFGEVPDDRLPELMEIADWMGDWATRSNRIHHNLLKHGDFPFDRQGRPLCNAFTSRGLTVPSVLMNQPWTVFDDPSDSSDDNFYDQIAWFSTGSGRRPLDLELRAGGQLFFCLTSTRTPICPGPRFRFEYRTTIPYGSSLDSNGGPSYPMRNDGITANPTRDFRPKLGHFRVIRCLRFSTRSAVVKLRPDLELRSVVESSMNPKRPGGAPSPRRQSDRRRLAMLFAPRLCQTPESSYRRG